MARLAMERRRETETLLFGGNEEVEEEEEMEADAGVGGVAVAETGQTNRAAQIVAATHE